MNNKKIGSDFEKEVCKMLQDMGYWVHFITPDMRGAQPFDIIAVKNGTPYAIDCKTCVSKTFSISRLEENQIFAFEKWMQCGNNTPLIFIKYLNKILIVSYVNIKNKRKINLEKDIIALEMPYTVEK